VPLSTSSNRPIAVSQIRDCDYDFYQPTQPIVARVNQIHRQVDITMYLSILSGISQSV
jgi:hypothetical protein